MKFHEISFHVKFQAPRALTGATDVTDGVTLNITVRWRTVSATEDAPSLPPLVVSTVFHELLHCSHVSAVSS